MPAKRPSRKRAAAEEPKKVTSGEFAVALQWPQRDDLPTIYANQLFISHAGAEFYLLFGEAVPPVIWDPASVPETIEVKPVARLAISPTAMIRMNEVINQNVARLLRRLGQNEGNDQENGA